jgi:hypothetical protein
VNESDLREIIDKAERYHNRQHLAVHDLPRPDLWRYALRWDQDGKPALYQDGKRLTCKWRLVLDLDVPADPPGRNNANTAGGTQ